MNPFERVHADLVAARRVRVLAGRLAALAPRGGTLLDVGCGDGALTRRLGELRPDLAVRGLDVQRRPGAAIEVDLFDGVHLPVADRSVDTVLFVDVLHHAEQPEALLAEGARASRRAVLIKDHRLDGLFAASTLRFMDRIGNARHGVALPYHYWPEARWRRAFDELGLALEQFETELRLYPFPLSLAFDRRLHFIASLRVAGARGTSSPA